MYPVTVETDYVEQRSRLTSFFRLILSIPWVVVGIFWVLGAVVCSIVAWFAIVFTGRYPQGLYEFVAKALRFLTRSNAFQHLMTDEWPPFDGGEHPEYPVRVNVAPPPPVYNRWKTGFRFILLIPVLVMVYLYELLLRAISVISWVVIVITGRHPKGLFDVVRLAIAYETRATSYHWLVSETYPPLTAEDGEQQRVSSISPA